MATAPLTAAFLLALAIPVVDIDNTIFVQGGIYLLLVIILNPLLFKPWLAARARRHDAIEGALTKAKQLREDADTIGAEYDAKIADARDRALELRSKERREEESTQASMLSTVRDESATKLDEERKRLATQAQEARASLTGRVDELAADITTKILGRAS